MLQHTLDRACQVVDPDRVLTVISCDHVKWLQGSMIWSIAGRVLKQPSNLDTGPGIFFPTACILATDPSATILVLPSDHFVFPEQKFLSQIRRLAEEQWFRKLLVTRPLPNCKLRSVKSAHAEPRKRTFCSPGKGR